MRKQVKPGFTLIELMVVVTIIGIACALAVSSIVYVKFRNSLTDMVNTVQQDAIQTRALSMQTRRAAVFEVRPCGNWIDLRARGACWSPITSSGMYDGPKNFDDIQLYQQYQLAGARIGGAAALILDTSNRCSLVALDISPEGGAGFGICYSGRGMLLVRDQDPYDGAIVDCGGQGADAGPTTGTPPDYWQRACGASTPQVVNFDDGSTVNLSDGAVIMFNRYEGEGQGIAYVDVPRFLFFPTSGAPYGQVAP